MDVESLELLYGVQRNIIREERSMSKNMERYKLTVQPGTRDASPVQPGTMDVFIVQPNRRDASPGQKGTTYASTDKNKLEGPAKQEHTAQGEKGGPSETKASFPVCLLANAIKVKPLTARNIV